MECNFSEVADLQPEVFLKLKSLKTIFQKTCTYFRNVSFPELLLMSVSVSLATQKTKAVIRRCSLKRCF